METVCPQISRRIYELQEICKSWTSMPFPFRTDTFCVWFVRTMVKNWMPIEYALEANFMYIYKIDGYKTQCQTERINQPKVLTKCFTLHFFNYCSREEKDTERMGGGLRSQILTALSFLWQHTDLEYIIMMGKHKKHLLVKYHNSRCSQISYYLAVAKLHKLWCYMRIVS